MKAKWVARPFKYGDGVPWNDDRWEILAPNAEGKLVSVGGAMKTYNKGTIAFLCPHNSQHFIRTPQDAERQSEGLFAWGKSFRQALSFLKYRFPDPKAKLAELKESENANF